MKTTGAIDALQGVGKRLEGSTIQGHYYIEQLIQRGGMAWLYRARHQLLQEPMAIKILFPQWSDDPLVRVRFIDEAKIQFKLKHPNIVQVTDVIQDSGLIGIVQEWVEGEDLNQALQRINGPLETNEIVEVSTPLLEALDFAHEMGVVHRDIKPSNVLLGQTGKRITPKLADFGIAKILDDLGERTTTGTTLGTIKYISPEQIRDSKSVDHRADIYSFGVMLYRMATGAYPFVGSMESVMFKQLYEAPPRPREHNPSISPELEELILQCLTKEPEDRFPNCSEVLDELYQITPSRRQQKITNSRLFSEASGQPTQQNESENSFLEHSYPAPHPSEPSYPLGSFHTTKPNDIDQPPVPLFGHEPPFADPSSPNITNHFQQAQTRYPSQDQILSYTHQPTQPTISRGGAQTTQASPFSPAPSDTPGGGTWGEFMLETEDDDFYEIDDDPTQRPQAIPEHAQVQVQPGYNTGGHALLPIEDDIPTSFPIDSAPEQPQDEIEEFLYVEELLLDEEPQDPADQTRLAHDIEELSLSQPPLSYEFDLDDDEADQTRLAVDVHYEEDPGERTTMAPDHASARIAPLHTLSSVGFTKPPSSTPSRSNILAPIVSPLTPPHTTEEPPPENATMLEEAPSLSALMAAGDAIAAAKLKADPSSSTGAFPSHHDLPTTSPQSRPLKLERSGTFRLELGEHEQHRTSPSHSSLPEVTPSQPLDFVPEYEVEEPIEYGMESSQSLVQYTMGTSDYEQYIAPKRSWNPIIVFPLIGVGLGVLVLGTSWLILHLKNESAKLSSSNMRTIKTRRKKPARAHKRRATPPKKAKKAKPFSIGCQPNQPKGTHQLALTIKPATHPITLQVGRFSRMIHAKSCIQFKKLAPWHIKQSSFATCTFTPKANQTSITITLSTKDGKRPCQTDTNK